MLHLQKLLSRHLQPRFVWKCEVFYLGGENSLREKDELSLRNKKVAIYSYFPSITNFLNLFESLIGVSIDQIYDSIENFGSHPSIRNIKNKIKFISKFSIKQVSEEFVKYVLKDFSSNKAAVGEILLKLLKDCDFTFHHLTNCIHDPKNSQTL